MNDPLIDYATVPATPLHPGVLAARAPLARVVADLLAVPDGTLDGPWRWRPTDTDDMELRYGFYAIHEDLERAIGAIVVGRAGASGDAAAMGPAVPALGAMAEARWDLHGVLAGLAAETWDADPGGGEWTVRQTMGHILGAQLSYSWYNAWYLAHPLPVDVVVRPPESDFPPEPTEDELATGSPSEVQARFDSIVDGSAAAVGALHPGSMDVGARWSGLPVTIGFRLGRYGSHIREHTIQVDKTLGMLGREPTEVERLVRLILATYGRLEALVIGRPATDLDRPLGDGASAIEILGSVLADAEATATSVRATATIS